MASAVQNPVTSTKQLSESLVFNVVRKLGSASLSDVHKALRSATSGVGTTFYIGRPLRSVLEDSVHIHVVCVGAEPKYALTSLGKKAAREHAQVVSQYFPYLRDLKRAKVATRRGKIKGRVSGR